MFARFSTQSSTCSRRVAHHALYVATREREGREASPTAAIIDSQSAKAAQKGAPRLIRRALMRPRRSPGSAGKITNCQIGVFAAYVSRHGHAFIDRALYLPKGWTDDPARLKATYVPGDIGFSTKPQLAAEMIERALAAGVPFRWVAADSGVVPGRRYRAGPTPSR